ncbi:MAG: hypothetical protein ACK4NW_14055, partial [Roseinatronobacter sp.]
PRFESVWGHHLSNDLWLIEVYRRDIFRHEPTRSVAVERIKTCVCRSDSTVGYALLLLRNFTTAISVELVRHL